MIAEREEFLVGVWEKCYNQHKLEAVITLLNSVMPSVSKKEIASMNIGERNYFLYSIREKIFGKEMVCYTSCPRCNTKYEFNFSRDGSDVNKEENKETYSLITDGFRIVYKIPDSFDLSHVSHFPDTISARNELLAKCILELSLSGSTYPVSELPESIVLKLSEDIASRNRYLETVINLNCESCKSEWSVYLDIGEYVLKELNFYALNILKEVHVLASAYHWRESEIMTLSSQRRNWYINEINS